MDEEVVEEAASHHFNLKLSLLDGIHEAYVYVPWAGVLVVQMVSQDVVVSLGAPKHRQLTL